MDALECAGFGREGRPTRRGRRSAPGFPFNLFPYIAGAWLLIGLASVLFVPGLARRIGANLAAREDANTERT